MTLSTYAYSCILQKLPAVQELVLDYGRDCTSLLATLASDPDLLPHLTTISLRRWTISSYNIQVDGFAPDYPAAFRDDRAGQAVDSLRRMSEDRHLSTLRLIEPRVLNDDMRSLFDGIARELVIIQAPEPSLDTSSWSD